MGSVSIDGQLARLARGCEQVYKLDELRAKLEAAGTSGRPLRIKLGLDPSAPDIHLGHTVVLRKMRQFQDLGHKAVLIIGDYTAMVGDPTGRSKTRPVLTKKAVEANAETYLDQAGRILDMSAEKLEIRRNSEWLAPMTFADVLRLAGKMTVARMLERDTFADRYKGGVEIYLHEFLYPLMQGYDSVVIESDVELGGTDQTFNNLVGRDFQARAGQSPQVVMILPILVGLDGTEKMSKSLGNYVGVTESAHDMFGKLMRVKDECMANYMTLLTDIDVGEIRELCGASNPHPMEAKKRMAVEIASAFYDADAVARAQTEWEQIHQKKAATGGLVVPEDTPVIEIAPGPMTATHMAVELKFASSNSEARRLITERGFRYNGQVIDDPNQELSPATGDVVQRGKRKFFKIVLPE
jgi:tyrosyl-tRNA synthetase